MKQTRILMGMPVTVEIVDPSVTESDLEEVYAYFTYVDETFSTYKDSSEISRINAGTHPETAWSAPMREIMRLCERTQEESHGYFNIQHNGLLDPSGVVKGWAIDTAARLVGERGFTNYYIDAGGDIQLSGHNAQGTAWRIGIRNPFRREEIIKVLHLTEGAVATSGTAIRGQHIYDPHHPEKPLLEVVSLTVVGPRIVDADRYATAAFAMGEKGIEFIASLPGFEGYQIDRHGIATYTPGFNSYTSS